MNFYERPVFLYLIIGIFSTCAAIILFKVGGSLAEVTGKQGTPIGVSFKAGGALAGFMLIYWMSLRAIKKLQNVEILQNEAKRLQDIEVKYKEMKINIKLYLRGGLDRQDETYICKYWILNEDTGEKKEFGPVKPRWEAGTEGNSSLALDIKDVGPDDWISIQIENSKNRVWLRDFFHSRAPVVELKFLHQ